MKKNVLFIVSVLAIFATAIQCGDNRNVTPPGSGTTPGTTPSPTPTFIWGGVFSVTNPSRYELLLKFCYRCGKKRVDSHSYQKIWDIWGNSSANCEHWLQTGYLQIEFKEKKLPTDATVTFQPEYSANRPQQCFGYPFAVKGRAEAINESKGFKVTLTPPGGLGGSENLYIRSDHSHHVSHSTLEVSINYGGESGLTQRAEILSAILQKQTVKPIKLLPNTPSTCQQPAPLSNPILECSTPSQPTPLSY